MVMYFDLYPEVGGWLSSECLSLLVEIAADSKQVRLDIILEIVPYLFLTCYRSLMLSLAVNTNELETTVLRLMKQLIIGMMP